MNVLSEPIIEIEKEFESMELHMTIVCVSDSEYVNKSVLVKVALFQSDSVNMLDCVNVFDSVNVFEYVNVSVGGRHSSIVVSLDTSSGPKLMLPYGLQVNSFIITVVPGTPKKY